MNSILPALSTIITAYNKETYIAEAIDSVRSQRRENHELIVVDDGSSDRTAEIIQSYEDVTYIWRERGGPAAALNTGVERARGALLSFLDGDDIWADRKLDEQLLILQLKPQVDIVQGYVLEFVSPELEALGVRSSRATGRPVPGPVLGASIVRRNAWDRIGPVRDDLRVGANVDWFVRAREHGLNVASVPQVVLHRRIHDKNHGRLAADSRNDFVRLLKASLDRRRNSEGGV